MFALAYGQVAHHELLPLVLGGRRQMAGQLVFADLLTGPPLGATVLSTATIPEAEGQWHEGEEQDECGYEEKHKVRGVE